VSVTGKYAYIWIFGDPSMGDSNKVPLFLFVHSSSDSVGFINYLWFPI